MTRPLFTFGMANYDDYEGVWPTVQAILLDLMDDPLKDECEIILVDNQPGAPSSKDVKQLFDGHSHPFPCKYIPAPEIIGTAAPRDLIFSMAEGTYTTVMDPHILTKPGTWRKLCNWWKKHSTSRDLITGPLWYDDLKTISTHYDDIWRGEMWGTWGEAWMCPCSGKVGDMFACIADNNKVKYIMLSMGAVPVTSSGRCKVQYPELDWNQHDVELKKLGFRKLGEQDEDEFEIPGQGLGLFSCRTDAWPGFNPHMRGFGGEEMYIHELFRQRGNKALCLGFLKWVHRFGRPRGVPYHVHNTRWNKVRNNVLTHLQLGRPLDRIYEHWVKGGLFEQVLWDMLIKDPLSPKPPRVMSPSLPDTLDGLYEYMKIRPRDLDQHFQVLRDLARKCPRIVEFSKRKESTVALAAGRPESFTSFNTEAEDQIINQVMTIATGGLRVEKMQSTEVEEIPDCDLLFIDSEHTYERLSQELKKFGGSCKRFIVMHDTVQHATVGQDSGPGLLPAMKEFMEANKDWFVYYHTPQQYGLTVIGRNPEDKPAERLCLWEIGRGPGTKLTYLLSEMGITGAAGCDCKTKAVAMDCWGVELCRQRRDMIVGWMKESYERWGWKEKLDAAGQPVIDPATGQPELVKKTLMERTADKARLTLGAVKTGVAFKVDPRDPFPGLVDLAIALAEKEEKEAA